jgi:hypothetical protein
VFLLNLLVAVILYVYLLKSAHVRTRTIAAVVALNIAVFFLLVPESMGVGEVGILDHLQL